MKASQAEMREAYKKWINATKAFEDEYEAVLNGKHQDQELLENLAREMKLSLDVFMESSAPHVRWRSL